MIGNVLYFNHPLERNPTSKERSVEKKVSLRGWTFTRIDDDADRERILGIRAPTSLLL